MSIKTLNIKIQLGFWLICYKQTIISNSSTLTKCCKYVFLREIGSWQYLGWKSGKGGISIINTEQIFFLVAHIFTTAEFHWLLDFSFSNSIPKPQFIHGMLAAILLVYISSDYCYPSFRISLLFFYLRVILATVLYWSSLPNFKKGEFLRVSTISLYLGSQISCIAFIFCINSCT